MSQFVKGLKASQLAPGSGACIETGGKRIALFNANGAFYAIENQCPRADGSLSEGKLVVVGLGAGLEAMPEGRMGHAEKIPGGPEVTCPACGSTFDLIAGCSVKGPAQADVETYPVRVNGEYVEIDIEE
jgi:nitrite reductase/ring-hydroxylating ferredoxin subunit